MENDWEKLVILIELASLIEELLSCLVDQILLISEAVLQERASYCEDELLSMVYFDFVPFHFKKVQKALKASS